jgi:hypothetical protein
VVDFSGGRVGFNGKGKGWDTNEVLTLRRLARQGTAEEVAATMERTVMSVRQKAVKSGISFRRMQRAALTTSR